MALDRIIRWHTKTAFPGKKLLEIFLVDYFQGVGEVKWDADRWFIRLPGKPSFAFGRIAKLDPMLQDERWIEVWPNKDFKCLDVMTRMQDEFTNGLAANIVEHIARYWKGQIEAG